MSSTTQAESLFKIIQKYKQDQHNYPDTLSEMIHIHGKNPDAKSQIKLLEDIRKYINDHLSGKEQKKAELGALLILRALLSDTNPEGQVFIYMVKNLGLEEEIEEVLHEVKPNEKMDPTHADYIKTSKEAIKACGTIIKQPEIIRQFSRDFIVDLEGTINTELDYDDRILLTLNPPQ